MNVEENNEYLEFHNMYKQVVEERYWSNYQIEPDAYPLYEDRGNLVVLIVNDTKYRFVDDIFILCKNDQCQDSMLVNYKFTDFDVEYEKMNDSRECITFFKGFFSEKSSIIFSYEFKDKPWLFSNYFVDYTIRAYRQEYSNAMNESNNELSKRTYDSRYNYTRLDVSQIIDYFTYDDSMQLKVIFEQSMFCYEHNKYLAAAACLGVGIEELCVLILEECGFDDGIRTKNTTIVELAGILRNKGVITRRVSQHLVASSIIRNSISHTSSGFASKETVDMLVASLKVLFEEYLRYKSRNG